MLHLRPRFFGVALVAAFLAAFAPAKSEAGLIYYDNFNLGLTTGTSPANAALLFTTTSGNGVMSSNFAIANVVSFTGTTNGAQNGDAAGAALALQNGTSNANAGGYLQVLTSTAGQSNIMVSFAIQATATGFQTDTLQYTTDGVNYTNFASFTPISSTTGFGAAGGLQTFDLSSITGLNNDVNAGFRLVFSNPGGGGSSTGNNRIDNVVISGVSAGVVPEPSSLILSGIALSGLAVAARARRKRVA